MAFQNSRLRVAVSDSSLAPTKTYTRVTVRVRVRVRFRVRVRVRVRVGVRTQRPLNIGLRAIQRFACWLSIVSRSQTLDGKVRVWYGRRSGPVNLECGRCDMTTHADNQRKRSGSEPAI